jgi:hypothetical protein
LQGQRKEQRPEGVALPHPALGPHHLFEVLALQRSGGGCRRGWTLLRRRHNGEGEAGLRGSAQRLT